MRPFYFFAIIATVLVLLGCSKSDNFDNTEGGVDIYLIKSFVESDTSDLIDVNTVVLEKQAFLDYDDLLSYNKKTYSFSITEEKKALFKLDDDHVHFKAFAVVANNEIIYTGFFWPSFSSQGINWVVIDPVMVEIKGELFVELGYPGMLSDKAIPDLRNDSRIINIFKRDDKLKE